MSEVKPKRSVKRYPSKIKEQAVHLYVTEERSDTEVAIALKVPRATVQGWLKEGGWYDLRREREAKIKAGTTPALKRIKDQAEQSMTRLVQATDKQVTSFVSHSLRVGKRVLSEAGRRINRDIESDELLTLSNAAKNGIAIGRQALGLDNPDQSSQPRISIGQITVMSRNPDQTLDNLVSCGVPSQPVTVNVTPVDNTSDKPQ